MAAAYTDPYKKNKPDKPDKPNQSSPKENAEEEEATALQNAQKVEDKLGVIHTELQRLQCEEAVFQGLQGELMSSYENEPLPVRILTYVGRVCS